MAENDTGQERTEQPTPKRLEDARKKGQVLRSRELNTLVSMIGIDKQLKGLSQILGTNQFPLLSLQLFDTWITNYTESDDIVEVLGHAA